MLPPPPPTGLPHTHNTPTEELKFDPAALPLIQTLLSLAAPDLHTLVLQHSATQPGRTPPNFPLLSHPFPCLRSLTLLGLTHHDWLLAAPLRAALTRPPLFPALTRLYINTPTESYSFDPAAWAPDTPLLTHLRLSAVSEIPPRLLRVLGSPDWLRVPLSLPAAGDGDAHAPSVSGCPASPAVTALKTDKWTRLERLVLHRRYAGNHKADAECAELLLRYKGGVERALDGKVQVEVVPAVHDEDCYIDRIRDARQEWAPCMFSLL